MDEQYLTISTDIKSDKQRVFDYITDYNRMDDYSDSVRVAVRGNGAGSRCYINIKKKVLEIPAEYTARVRFTEYEESNFIGWEMVEDLDLNGEISLNSTTDGCTMTLEVELDVSNSDLSSLPAPNQAGFEEITKNLYPKLEYTMNKFICDLVHDIEGSERDVKVRVESISDELDKLTD